MSVLTLFIILFGVDACAPPATNDDTQPKTQTAEIKDRTFELDLALTAKQREKGLGGVESISVDGGMLFVFRRPAYKSFVMRDCTVPIDIIFLGPRGEIIAMHEMEVEPPQRPGESDSAYENRLKSYESDGLAQFAIELKGGTMDELNLKIGDRIELPYDDLKARAE